MERIYGFDSDTELSRMRAAAYEHRLVCEKKKRAWRNNHACQVCYRHPVFKLNFCRECYKYESKAGSPYIRFMK